MFYLILSQVFRFGVFLRRLTYRWGIKKAVKLDRPVISVGNITVGGTGKTPLVKEIARYLSFQGKKVAILVHGWKGQAIDEVAELKEELPQVVVLAGRDRVMNGRRAIAEFGCNVILLDDGFQHWRLQRDIDIVVISARDPLGGGYLLPRGRLREAPPSLDRADYIVVTRCDSRNADKELNLPGSIKTIYQPEALEDLVTGNVVELETLRSQKVAALSAIVDAEYFHQKLEELGAVVAVKEVFGDHYLFTQGDIDSLAGEIKKEGINYLVVTAKDKAKLKALNLPASIQVLVLRITLKFINQGEDVGLLVSNIG